MSAVTFSVENAFRKGGRELIDLLEYCVLAVKPDVLFLYCAGEFRSRPQAVSAVAIHDLFCRQNAPARISPEFLLPPKDMRLEHQVNNYRVPTVVNESVDEVAAVGDSPQNTVRPVPPGYLFDSIVKELTCQSESQIASIESTYDPSLEPYENLDNKKISAGGRAFVNNIWLPLVRPQLVAAGFWRLSTVA